MKSNKKGFTLSELLIVIAIIAILIAIAIPAFGGALDNARLQTDHANMRNAYAIGQVIKLNGYIDKETLEGAIVDQPLVDGVYFFLANGKIAYAGVGGPLPENIYTLKTSANNTKDCSESIVCELPSSPHIKGSRICIIISGGGTEITVENQL